MRTDCRFLFTTLVTLFTLASHAQHVFNGQVLNSETGTPIKGVSISAGNRPLATTDAAGNFTFEFLTPSGNLSFTHIGFKSEAGDYLSGARLVIFMAPSVADLAELVVSAYEINSPLQKMPVSVGVLGKQDMERYGNASLIPAINTIPGVKMDERSPGSYRLSIRGNLLRSPFGVRNVKVYWNGIPFTDANGNTYLNQLGFSNVGKIEIIKGPGGSMYGAGTGGVVLLESPGVGYKENSVTLGGLAGSYGLREASVTYRNAGDNASQSLQYSHQQSDGWRQHTNTRRDVLNYTGSFAINPRQSISTNIFYSDLYYQTPGGLTTAQLNDNPRQARPAGGPFGSAVQQQAALYLKTLYAGFGHTINFNENWRNTTSIYTSHTRFRNPSILNYQRKTEQGIGGRSVTRYKYRQLQVHAGAEYQHGFTATRTFGNRSGTSDTLQFDDEIAATQYNLFLQGDLQLGSGFTINGGLSYNNYGYGFTRLNKRPVTEVKKTFDPVVMPRISVLKTLGPQLSVYATISQGYSPPTIDEIVPSTGLFNSTLAAERATNYEIGLRAQPIENKLFIEVAAYLFNLNNTIVTRRDAAGADFFVNTGNTDQRGFELSVNYYPIRNTAQFLQELHVFANYTHINAQFKTYQQGNTDFSGNQLTGTPPNVFVSGIDLSTRAGLYVNLTYSYTDLVPLNDANTFYGTQYNLFFGKLGFKRRIGKKLEGEIYASYDKSFNPLYGLGNDLNAAANRFYNPSAPQNVIGGLKLQFNL